MSKEPVTLANSMNFIRRNVNVALATATNYTIADVYVPPGLQLELHSWTVLCDTATDYCTFHVLRGAATGPVVFNTYISNGQRVNLATPVVLKGGQHYWVQMAHVAGVDSVLAGTIYARMCPDADLK